MTGQSRTTYIFLLIVTFALLGMALFLQYALHWQPCTLCIIDRAILWMLAALFIIAIVRNPRGVALHKYTVTGILLSLGGIAVSARHVWLLYLPEDKMPACTPDLHYLLDILPTKVALMTFLTSGECAKNPGYILTFPLPLWTIIAFVVLTLGIIFAAWKNQKKRAA